MNLLITIFSMLVYLIIINRCLTFRLTIWNNIIITAILAFFIITIDFSVSAMFVLPMFATVFIYIYCLKKEDVIWNIFLIMFSYMVTVIMDNVAHFIWKMAGIEPTDNWLSYTIYEIILCLILYIICGFVSKKTKKIKEKNFLALPSRIIAVAGAELLLCMFIFAIHITITDAAGAPPMLLLCSDGLFIAYFVLTFLMITMIIREYEVNARMTMKQNSYDNLQEYMSQIEELYQNIRVFRHDYANVMASMAAYLNDNDIEGLKVYYEKHIFPIYNILDREKDVISRLNMLDIVELKGLISVKINYAQEMNIKINLEMADKIEKINMNTLDLVRITGIFLDNAIEACQECADPCIDFGMIKTKQGVTLIIRNTYVKKEIDYSRLGSLGITSKGERRGIGLYNVKSIIGNYDNIIMETEYEDLYFTQIMEIYEEDQINI